MRSIIATMAGAAAALGLSAMPAAAAPAPRPAGVTGTATVLDGDTLQVDATRVRLHGVDAFEAEQVCTDVRGAAYPCGGQATRYLSRLAAGRLVSCSGRDVDAYGRLVAVCSVGGVDLGAAMVRAGLAVAFRRYALDYVPQEEAARRAQAGAWSGTFTAPADHRAAARGDGARRSVAVAQRAAPASGGRCRIKGNINRRGERIYHLPSDPYYGPTKPEAVFCSEQEAESAGFRRARRPGR